MQVVLSSGSRCCKFCAVNWWSEMREWKIITKSIKLFLIGLRERRNVRILKLSRKLFYVSCYLHLCVLLSTFTCLVIYIYVSCYLYLRVLLSTFTCLSIYVYVFCYLHLSVLLSTFKCLVIYIYVSCYLHLRVLLSTFKCLVIYI
jgi:hypothetical protein